MQVWVPVSRPAGRVLYELHQTLSSCMSPGSLPAICLDTFPLTETSRTRRSGHPHHGTLVVRQPRRPVWSLGLEASPWDGGQGWDGGRLSRFWGVLAEVGAPAPQPASSAGRPQATRTLLLAVTHLRGVLAQVGHMLEPGGAPPLMSPGWGSRRKSMVTFSQGHIRCIRGNSATCARPSGRGQCSQGHWKSPRGLLRKDRWHLRMHLPGRFQVSAGSVKTELRTSPPWSPS